LLSEIVQYRGYSKAERLYKEDGLNQIFTLWGALDLRRKIGVAVGMVLMISTIALMSRIAARPGMSLLYSGLNSASAGEVIASLEQRGIKYSIKGDAIHVPSSERDALRLTLAAEGLPDNGTQGYELLDSLTGFGTTSQMFDAAYWRAKEGELARTILASPHVSHARVHIANGNSGAFSGNLLPTASISVTPSSVPITPIQANAIRFLVASAISGLVAENVTVVDANGSLISANQTGGDGATDSRSQTLRERVLRLLEARVGPGNAVVEVSVEAVTETESFRERRFDPDGRVAISSDVEESTNKSDAAGGEVTVASNLPDGEGAGQNGHASASNLLRERINYEVSESEREILRSPGSVKRITVAVLVNFLPSLAETTAALPRTENELAALKELVSAAVGFDVDRGDVITIKSMEFPQVTHAGSVAVSGLLTRLGLDVMALIKFAILAIVALILGLFVLRPVLVNRRTEVADTAQHPELPFAVGEAYEPLDGEIQSIDPDNFPSIQVGVSPQEAQSLPIPEASSSADTMARLRDLIGDRQEETVEILRNWLEEKREDAG
jgi:flagellar M-ring protein FliF